MRKLPEATNSRVAVRPDHFAGQTGGAWSANKTMGELNQKLLDFIWTLVFWLEKLIIELSLPILLIGALVLLFSRKWGWRIIWSVGIAVLIALLAKPVFQALPGIISSISWPN